jgi:hypothetical protein
MTDAAFKKAVLRGIYLILLGVIQDKRCDLGAVLDWRKEVLADEGPEPFYKK